MLTEYEFKFIIGKKGNTKEIILRARDENFPHLLGLDKLTDVDNIFLVDDSKKKPKAYKGNKHNNRSSNLAKELVIKRIENKELTLSDLTKSEHFSSENTEFKFAIGSRIEFFSKIEPIFTAAPLPEEAYFTFYKAKAFSSVDAEYLFRLKLKDDKGDLYLNFFLKKDTYDNSEGKYYCPVSFFPRRNQDYEKGQSKWTLLYKLKTCISDSSEEILYQSKSYSEDPQPLVSMK